MQIMRQSSTKLQIHRPVCWIRDFFAFFSSHCNNIKHLIICVKYSMLLMGSDGTFWAFLQSGTRSERSRVSATQIEQYLMRDVWVSAVRRLNSVSWKLSVMAIHFHVWTAYNSSSPVLSVFEFCVFASTMYVWMLLYRKTESKNTA